MLNSSDSTHKKKDTAQDDDDEDDEDDTLTSIQHYFPFCTPTNQNTKIHTHTLRNASGVCAFFARLRLKSFSLANRLA